MIRLTPRCTRTYTPLPYTSLFRSKCPSTTARKWKRSATFTNRRSASAEELLFPVCPELVEGPFFSLNVEEQGRGFDKLSPNGSVGDSSSCSAQIGRAHV